MITMTDISTATLVERSGATERQINWWYYQGVISTANDAVGSGRPRRWDESMIKVARVLAEVSNALNTSQGGGGCPVGVLSAIAARVQLSFTSYDLSDTVTISWKAPT